MVRIHVGQPLFLMKMRAALTPAQNLAGFEPPKIKFPKVIRHRKAGVTIYGKKPKYPFYRIAYRVAGERHLLSFKKYGDALEEAGKKVRVLAEGSATAALTADQARDALSAYERLNALRLSLGRPSGPGSRSSMPASPAAVPAAPKMDGQSLDRFSAFWH